MGGSGSGFRAHGINFMKHFIRLLMLMVCLPSFGAVGNVYVGEFIDTQGTNTGGSFTGDPSQFGTNSAGATAIKSGAVVTNLTVHSSFQMTTNSSDVIRFYDGQQMYWNVRGVDVGNLWMNGSHGGNGNGTEFQWSFNQCSFNMFGGGWFQIGAVDGSGLESAYMAANRLTSLSNTNSPSHFFGFSYSYNNGGARADFVNMQAIPVGTNGEVTLRIYAPVGGSPLPTSMPSTNMLDIDSVTGVKSYGNLSVGGSLTITNGTSGILYLISSGGNTNITLDSGLGTATASNGFASFATNAPTKIQPSGITNGLAVMALAYVTCTNANFTNFNAAGTAVLTNTAVTFTNQMFMLQPGGFLKAAVAGVLSGNLIPF